MIKITIKEKKYENGRWVITGEDGKRYSFFEKKQTGEPTKAYEQWKKYQLGDAFSVMAEVKESAGKDKKGNPITYYNIIYFQEENLGDTKSPMATFNKVPPAQENSSPSQIKPTTGNLEERVQSLEDIVRGMAMELQDLRREGGKVEDKDELPF